MSEETKETVVERDATEVMLQEMTFVLDGEEIKFPVKSIRDTHGYRAELGKIIAKVFSNSDVGKALSKFISDAQKASTSGDKKEADNVGQSLLEDQLPKLLPALLPVLLADGIGAFETLLTKYAPELEGKIKQSTDDEIIDAATEVIVSTFPLLRKSFSAAISMISRIGASGLAAKAAKAQGD